MKLLTHSTTTTLLLVAVGAVLYFYNPIADLAAAYNNIVFKSGGTLYASLRALTSVMSIVRDADVQISIPITSLSTSPGQALEPVISTLDRMTNLLFAVVIASGVLAYILPIIASLGGLLIAVGSLLRAFSVVVGTIRQAAFARAARGLIALGVIAAVGLPAVYTVAFFAGDYYTASAWQGAKAVFERNEAEVSGLDVSGITISDIDTYAALPASEPEQTDANPFERAKDAIGDAVGSSADAIRGTIAATAGLATTMREKAATSAAVITNGVQMADDLFDASVQIAAAYLVKLFVLPLLLLGGMIYFLRFVRENRESLTADPLSALAQTPEVHPPSISKVEA